MKRYRWNQAGLAGNAFLSGHEDRIALVLPGLPYVPGEQPYFKDLQDAGYAVVQPQYHGTYDSSREFSPHTAVASVRTAIEAVRHGLVDARSMKKIVTGAISLFVGHSFGSWVLYNSVDELPPGSAAVLLAPFLAMGRFRDQAGVLADMSGQVEYITRALPYSFRISDTGAWHDFFGDGDFPFATSDRHDRVPTILAVGAQDGALDPQQLRVAANRFATTSGTRIIETRVVPDAGHGAGSLFRGAGILGLVRALDL